jgi:hypothetical protein
MTHGPERADFAKIVFLAIEIEALGDEDAFDGVLEADVLHTVEQNGQALAVAGMVLTLLSRLKSGQASRLWSKIPVVYRNALLPHMVTLQPQVTVRSLGAAGLRDVLKQIPDSQLHDKIADALSSVLVPDSESCLEVLFPAACERLAVALAERYGRAGEPLPDAMSVLPKLARTKVLRASAFGALRACLHALFAEITVDFLHDDWEAMMTTAKKRAADMNSASVAMLLAAVPDSVRSAEDGIRTSAALPGVGEHDRAKQRNDLVFAFPAASDADRLGGIDTAPGIIAFARQAAIGDMPMLAGKSAEIQGRSWRTEARSAVLRRALELRVKLPGLRSELPRYAVAAVIAEVRLGRGETAVLQRSTWRSIGADRKFSLLSAAVSLLEVNAIVPTMTRLDQVAQAILSLEGAMRDVLGLRFVTNLGSCSEMRVETLDRFAQANGHWQDEVVAAVARSHALRGQTETAHALMDTARRLSEKRARDASMNRLFLILENPALVPTDKVRAVVSALATVSGADLREAVELCFECLPTAEREFVAADVIARGRAADAFADTLLLEVS